LVQEIHAVYRGKEGPWVELGMVTKAYNYSYLGCRDGRIVVPAWARKKYWGDPILTNKLITVIHIYNPRYL
jgi:hypothetical protein